MKGHGASRRPPCRVKDTRFRNTYIQKGTRMRYTMLELTRSAASPVEAVLSSTIDISLWFLIY